MPIFSGMENEPPEQTVKELQQMLENQKIGFMKFVFKIIGDTREREKLLREMNEKIEWLKVGQVWVCAVTVNKALGPQEGEGENQGKVREKHPCAVLALTP